MSTPQATVVVVNYNGGHLLPPCLDGLRRQDTPPGFFETVVVDNASVDGSRELLARDFPEVRVIASPANTGFAGGNNLALREVSTPYVALLNNDAVPAPDWLRRLLAPFAAPGAERLGVVTGKVVFAPRFLPLRLETAGFSPGPQDPRELGVRVLAVEVDGRDVTEKVLWEQLTYGPEGSGTGRFRWTRPAGGFLVPLLDGPDAARGSVKVTFRWAAERDKPVSVAGDGVSLTATAAAGGSEAVLAVPEDVPLVDVVNNAGSIVLRTGHGADRGFQEPDTGQYDEPAEVFAACGNGMALRTAAGREAGWFDDDFFLYYEDTDLSWRLRARGWAIRYEPTAVLRHLHSASSTEWSPLWLFHVERNRLLMLTKDASAPLARRAVRDYLLTAGSLGLRAAREGLRTRSRPAVRPHLLRARVLASYLRLLPTMLRRRREVGATAALSRRELERWLVSER
ncbi:MAG TPA: glycosyltransferase [Mycobacteriales bacterium]|nr:glycosyltransferase [Mycobacteriales bacterium]